MIAFERVVAAFAAEGLRVDHKGTGKAAAQAPGHTPADRSVSITAIDGQVLVHSHSDPTDHVLDTLGLSATDLFDSPKGVAYQYDNGRVVHRSPTKRIRQSGTTKGTACLYRLARLADASTVYVTEGEKDCHALESVGVVATTTPQGAGKAHLCDLSPLYGKDVVIVADRDDAGYRHAGQLVDLLTGRARSVTVVEAAEGKDAADHVAAGHGIDAFVPSTTVAAPLPARRIVPQRASEVRIKRVRFLMDNWVVLGAVNLLAGREGIGKSTLAVWIAAHVTRGSMRGELYGQPRTVIYLATEDDPAFTIVPRLKAAGADLDRVLFLPVHTDTTTEGVVSLPGDLAELERVIAEHNVALVVLDAATSVMDSKLDGHDDRKVRQFLEPLARTAARFDCAVLGICHFGKREGSDTGRLLLGSIAWSQVARSVLAVAQHPDTGDLVITNAKRNLSPETRSAAARVVSAPVDTDDGQTFVGTLTWLGDTDIDARDLLDTGTDDSPTAATAWLEDYLTEQGTAQSRDVKTAARKADISERSLQRAAKKLGVVVTQAGWPRLTHWALPNTRAPTPERDAPPQPTSLARLKVVDPTTVPEVRTPGRTANQWLASGEPLEKH